MTQKIIHVGHTLLTGVSGSYQGLLASEIAFQRASQGTTLVQLVDHEAERSAAQARAQLWLRYRGISPDKFRHRVVCAYPYRDEAAIALAIDNELSPSDRDSDLLIFRDLTTHVLPLLPGATWFRIGFELSEAMETPVLTAASYGQHPMMRPKSTEWANVSWAWEVTADVPPNLEPIDALKVKLTLLKPAGKDVVKWRSVTRNGLILWDEEQKELAHD